MNVTALVLVAALSQYSPLPPVPPPGPPAPYFTQLADHAGVSGMPGSVDGLRFFTGRLTRPMAMTSDAAGNVWVLTEGAVYGTSVVRLIAGDSIWTWSAPLPFHLSNLGGLVVDPSTFELFFTNRTEHTVYRIPTWGAGATLHAGFPNFPALLDGNRLGALFASPSGITIDANRNLYVSDSANHTVRKITPAGNVTTLFPSISGFTPTAIAMDAARNRVVLVGNSAIYVLSLTGGNPGWVAGYTSSVNAMVDGDDTVARFANPTSVAVDAAGNIFVGDYEVTSLTPPGATFRGGIRQIRPGQYVPRYPSQSYPTTVVTLSLAPAYIQLRPNGFWSDPVLDTPAALTWLGSSLAVSDPIRSTVRLIR